MSFTIPINQADPSAPTPQNTPLTYATLTAGLSRPTVPDITEDNEEEEGEDAPIGAAGLQQAMMGIVQSRLGKLMGKSSGYIESLPVEVKKSVEALKGVQIKQVELQNRYKREVLELEKKYLELQKPLYDRRYAIITGATQPSSEEVEAGEQVSAKEDPDYSPLPKESPAAAIPEFWLTALRNYVVLSEIITERDAGALKHLVDIRISYLLPSDSKPGFKLSFVFNPNEYFENEILEKTYLYQEEVGYTGDFVYDHAVGTEIKWKDDKDLTKELEIKKQRNKNTGRTRLIRKARPTDSFFNFFSPPVPPAEDAFENGDLDEEELEEVEEKLEIDYQIGEDIKEKIIPRAIDYFTGKALEYEEMDEEDDFEDFDDDDDDDDDENRFEDQDSDDDDEEDHQPRRRGPQKRSGAAPNVDAEECKQQ